MDYRKELKMSVEQINNKIADLKEKIKEANEELKCYQEKKQDCQKRIDDYIDTNPLAQKRRDYEEKMKKNKSAAGSLIGWFVFLEIVLFVLCLVFENRLERMLGMDILYIQLAVLALPLILIVVSIVKRISTSKYKEKIDAMAAQLAEFDKSLNPLHSEWNTYASKVGWNEKRITDYQEKIKDLEIDLKYVQYEKNYALVFVGRRNTYTNKWTSVRHTIEIDGIDHGYAEIPFKPIYVSPGMHTIKVTCTETTQEYILTHTSQVTQFDASQGSVYFEFERGPLNGVSTKVHKSHKAFFESTGLEP